MIRSMKIGGMLFIWVISVTHAFAQCPHILSETGSNPVCENDSLRLDATALGNSYQWYRNAQLIPGATLAYIYVNTAGIYNCIVEQGCGTDSATAGISVATNNVPNVVLTPASDTSYCSGDSILLNGSPGGISQWYRNGMALLNAASPVYYATMPGVYNMTKTNTKGCVDSASAGVLVTEDALPVVTLTPLADTSYCSGDSVLLNGSPGGSSQWYRNGVAVLNATSPAYYAAMPGVYNMTKTNTKGCVDSASAGVMVAEDPIPVASFTKSADTVNLAAGGLLTLNLNTTNPDSVKWYFGDGDSVMVNNPGHTYTQTGAYEIVLIVYKGMCRDTARDSVRVVNITSMSGMGTSGIKLQLYPNPVRNDLLFEVSTSAGLTHDVAWMLFAADGKRLAGGLLPTGFGRVGTEALPPAVYFLHVHIAGIGYVVRRFVKIPG